MAMAETNLARDGDEDAHSSVVVGAHSGDPVLVDEELHDDNGDQLLLSADALLFMLEEDEEELLILDGVDADATDLADLDFSDLSGSTDNSSEEQLEIPCNLEPTVSSGAISPSYVDEMPRKHPGKPKSSELRFHPRPPRVRTLWTLQPVAAPPTASVQSKSSAPQPDPKKANPSGGRKRVKDELEYLRQHVSDLEEQLRQLKSRQGDCFQSTHDPSSSSSSNSLSSTLWKRVASRQQDGRRKAEAENARLRDLLEAQLRLARSLARTLRKRPNLSDVNPIQSESEVKWRQLNPHGDAAVSAIFAHLEENLGPLYVCVDAVLQETGFPVPCKREIRESQVKMDACGRLFLEIVDSTIVPFDLETTSAGYWKFYNHSSMDHRHELCSLKALDVTSDTLRAQFSARLPVQRGGVEALVHGYMIGKQFTEETRVVGVWSSVGELKSKLFGDGRITLRETGWTVIEAMPSTKTGGSPSTIIQMVVRMTPEVGDGNFAGDSFVSETQSSHVGLLTDLVLGSFLQNLDSMHQMTESMILMEMAQR